jgi:antitoxin MazE
MSYVRLNRWGHSTGLRIPVAVLSAAGLTSGRSVSLRVLDNGDIRVRPVGEIVPAEPENANTAAATEDESEWEQW